MRSFKSGGLAVCVAILGLTAAAISTTVAETAPETDHCAINAETRGGAISINGSVAGDPGASGTYRMTVTGGSNGGTTSISQGGAFVLDDAGESDLGLTRLTAGGIYDVRLELKLNGETYRCTERFGDRI